MQRELMENKTHGTALFPFEIYKTANAAGELFVPCHWHDGIELLYFLKGSAIVTIGGRNYEDRSPAVIFVNKEELHQIQSHDPALVYAAFVFSALFYHLRCPTEFRAVISLLLRIKACGLRCRPTNTAVLLRKYLGIPERDEKKSSGYQIYVKAALLKMPAAEDAGLLKSGPAEDRADRERLKIQRSILRFLDLHYSEHRISRTQRHISTCLQNIFAGI